MRNYLFTRAIAYTIDYFDDTHTYQGTIPANVIGRNDVDLKTQIDTFNQTFLNSLPANWTIEPTYQNDAFTLYFLMDKENLMRIIYTFQASFVQDAIANVPPFFPTLSSPKETPRKTGWTDDAGVKRAPTPSDKLKRSDFSGAAGLVTFISSLPAYAAILKKEGRLRDAGIVLEIYNNVVDGRISITDALAQLRAAGL